MNNMITLKTLESATQQEVFDQVKNHLLTQNEKSQIQPINESYFVCQYKTDNFKCAAGCLIGDDEYEEKLEYKSWESLVRRKYVPEAHVVLIKELQGIHDGYVPKKWEEELKKLAETFKLKYE